MKNNKQTALPALQLRAFVLRSKWGVWLGLVLTVVALFFLPQLRITYEFNDMLSKNSETSKILEQFQADFESTESIIQVAFVHENGIFDYDFLSRYHRVCNEVKEWTDVKQVVGLTSLTENVRTGRMVTKIPWLHWEHAELYAGDSIRIFTQSPLVGAFLAKDAQSVILRIVPREEMTKSEADALVSELYKTVAAHHFDAVHYAGRIIGQHYFVEKMEGEVVKFGIVAFLLLCVFLWLTFRSAFGLWVPVAIVVITLIWTLAILTGVGKSLGLLTNIMPTIVLVVGISDVIHLLSGFLDLRRNGYSRKAAVYLAFRRIGWATLLTSVTTAIGFITLLTAPIPALNEFGVFTALGVVLALIVTFLFVPGLLLFPKRVPIESKVSADGFWHKPLNALFYWALRYRRQLIFLPLVLAPVLIIGLSQLKIDNYFLDDLPKGDPHRADFEFFESRYGGIRLVDFYAKTNSGATVIQSEVLEELQRLDSLLITTFGVDKILSLPTLISQYHREQEKLNNSSQSVLHSNTMPNSVLQSRIFRTVINEAQNAVRITLETPDIGGAKMLVLEKQLEQLFEQEFQLLSIAITGFGHEVDVSNREVVAQMVLGLLLAFLLVGLLMGGLFRSIQMVVIAIVVNLLPLAIIAAIMGYSGIDLKITTAIVFTIIFGIAVDDTIHYLAKFKSLLQQGYTPAVALRRTSVATGKALVITTMVLLGGFITLTFSGFTSIFYIGLLVSMALVFALVIDLTLLPVLLMYFYKKK
ncbi:MAG: MMPL family transporter [Schleiferiaceae bacterium]|nr:MMPL family transporter [Schleiferiaceae bacterium]